MESEKEFKIDWFESFSFIGILSLLYFGLIPKDWHFIEDIKQMVVPFTILSMFSGALVFVLPWNNKNNYSGSTVFLIGLLIALVAISMHIFLMKYVGFRPVPIPEHKKPPQWFYGLVAILSSRFFGLGTLSGYIGAYFMTHAISNRHYHKPIYAISAIIIKLDCHAISKTGFYRYAPICRLYSGRG